MTRATQKLDELRFALETARLLSEEWKLVPREEESDGGPDFIVDDTNAIFGLEVVELFKGPVSKKSGARLKTQQSDLQKNIDQIRQRYEEIEANVPLYVKFLGSVRQEDVDSVVQTLLDMKLRERCFPYQEEHVLREESDPLKIFVSRLPDGWPVNRLSRPDWFSLSDAGGWVEKDPRMISVAIRVKAGKIDKYRENVARNLGLECLEDVDMRLLLVADHMWNYGQIDPGDELIENLHGFSVVYFLSFPEKVIVVQGK